MKFPPHPQLSLPTPQIADIEGLGESGSGAHVSERGAARGRVAVFDPVIEVLGGQAAHVGGEIRLAPISLQNRTNSLVPNWLGSYLWLAGALARFFALPEIGAAGTLVGGPDAVAPVVAVGEAAAGKAHDRRS